MRNLELRSEEIESFLYISIKLLSISARGSRSFLVLHEQRSLRHINFSDYYGQKEPIVLVLLIDFEYNGQQKPFVFSFTGINSFKGFEYYGEKEPFVFSFYYIPFTLLEKTRILALSYLFRIYLDKKLFRKLKKILFLLFDLYRFLIDKIRRTTHPCVVL